MFTFLTILAIIVCLLLILFILIQNPKGGGLSSTFGASNQIMGVQKTGDFLEKSTWGLAIVLLVICLSMKIFSPSTTKDTESLDLQKQADQGLGAPTGPMKGTSKAPRPTSSPAAVPTTPPAAPSKK